MAAMTLDGQTGACETYIEFETNARGRNWIHGHEGLRREYHSIGFDHRTTIVAAIEKWVLLNDYLETTRNDYWSFMALGVVYEETEKPIISLEILGRLNGVAGALLNAIFGVYAALDGLKVAYGPALNPATRSWVEAEQHERVNEDGFFRKEVAVMNAKRDPGRKIPDPNPLGRDGIKQLAVRSRFRDDSLYPDGRHVPGRWKCMRMFNGGMSQGGVWVLFDETDNTVRDRIVKKNMYMDHWQWRSSSQWHGDPNDFDNRVPLEVYLQQKCWQASRHHFPEIVTWSQDHQNLVMTMYVEYCAHGDLSQLSDYYFYGAEPSFPEPFLWMLFLRMVECCLVMRQGSWHGPPAAKWRQIVHRDIKSANVFLSAAHGTNWPHYPMPKLADFGLAFETYENDPSNPSFYNLGSGTKPFLAPEQSSFKNSITGQPVDDHKLWDHTNVYGICAMMFELVTGYILGREMQPKFLPGEPPWAPSNWTKRTYSADMLRAIMLGLRWDPRARPTLEDLRTMLVDGMNRTHPAMAQYMRAAHTGVQPPLHDDFGLALGEEKYRLLMAEDEIEEDDEEEEE